MNERMSAFTDERPTDRFAQARRVRYPWVPFSLCDAAGCGHGIKIRRVRRTSGSSCCTSDGDDPSTPVVEKSLFGVRANNSSGLGGGNSILRNVFKNANYPIAIG